MGNVVAPPETMNIAITATYVIAHSTQNVFSWTYDAQPRYRTKARPTVDSAKMYAGTDSRVGGRRAPAGAGKQQDQDEERTPRRARPARPTRLP